MVRVLVTGAAGVLGRQLVNKLSAAGYVARGTGRRNRPIDLPADVEWVQADLASATSLVELVAGVDTIVHAASNPLKNTQQVDEEGTRRLLAVARSAGTGHFVYISIVGIERIPLEYYRHKLATESIVMNGGVPWTILRATQFHDLLDRFLRGYMKFPLAFLPAGFKFQPVDSSEVSDALVECVVAGPGGRVPDIGGPNVQTLGELARPWLKARQLRRVIVPIRPPGQVAGAFRHGYNTCPQCRHGGITWADWLERTYAPARLSSSKAA